MPNISKIKISLIKLKNSTCRNLIKEDEEKIPTSDEWRHPARNNATTRLITNHQVFEKSEVPLSLAKQVFIYREG